MHERGFQAGDEAYLALTPDLTIVGASDAYLQSTLLWHEQIKGRHVFEVFPDNPAEPEADGEQNLGRSLRDVLAQATPQAIFEQRYDVRDYVSGEGDWVTRYWRVVNTPVFGSGSDEITHVIHQVADVSHAVIMRRWLAQESHVVGEQIATLEQMLRDLAERRAQLERGRAEVADFLAERMPKELRLTGLPQPLGAPDERRYLGPNDYAPRSGLYEAFHYSSCGSRVRKLFVREGKAFPQCRRCRGAVLYRLKMPM